uniref:Reverse transcriptase domain-containing protein n=1 Tax=Trichuris muris TaxID=70415 RepID=A0A5S6Q348_TRIMR
MDNFKTIANFTTMDNFKTMVNFKTVDNFKTEENFKTLPNFKTMVIFKTVHNFKPPENFKTVDNFKTMDNFKTLTANLSDCVRQAKERLGTILDENLLGLLVRHVELSAFLCTQKEQAILEKKFNRLICSKSWEFRSSGSGSKRCADTDLDKIVVNLSSRILTSDEKEVLAKGLNFVPTPPKINYLDLISIVESEIRKDEKVQSDTLRSLLTSYITQRHYRPVLNLSRLENRILRDLKRDDNIMITKADKGNVVVILDREMYNSKVKDLLDTDAYTPLQNDPTDKVRKHLIKLLSQFYDETREEQISRFLKKLKYSSNFSPPEMFCFPKIHKVGVPLRPIVACGRGVVTELSRYLAKLLRPLTGLHPSHTINSSSFVKEVVQVDLQPEDILVSYDVKDLFTSVPLGYTFDILFESLSKDVKLTQRTKLNPYHLSQLVKFCVEEGNYFHWNGSYFSQKEGAPMGSPLSPVVAEIFMEHLEVLAFKDGFSSMGVKMFKRYVDDIFVIIEKDKEGALLDHLNSIFAGKITFTMEREENGKLAFLDCLVIRDQGHIKTKVFRKPTNSERYLNFHSNHPLFVKKGIITGMVDRAYSLCHVQYLADEIKYIKRILLQNGYPKYFMETTIRERMLKLQIPGRPAHKRQVEEPGLKSICIPYYPGIGEGIRKIARTIGYRVVFKSLPSLFSLLRSDKVKIQPDGQAGVVYCIKSNCGARYIGETRHTLPHRLNEHKMALTRYKNAEKRLRGEFFVTIGRPQRKDPGDVMKEAVKSSAWVEHSVDCQLALNINTSCSILEREQDFRLRKIKEAFYIRHNPCINRDEGVEISKIWSVVAFMTDCASIRATRHSEPTTADFCFDPHSGSSF